MLVLAFLYYRVGTGLCCGGPPTTVTTHTPNTNYDTLILLTLSLDDESTDEDSYDSYS